MNKRSDVLYDYRNKIFKAKKELEKYLGFQGVSETNKVERTENSEETNLDERKKELLGQEFLKDVSNSINMLRGNLENLEQMMTTNKFSRTDLGTEKLMRLVLNDSFDPKELS